MHRRSDLVHLAFLSRRACVLQGWPGPFGTPVEEGLCDAEWEWGWPGSLVALLSRRAEVGRCADVCKDFVCLMASCRGGHECYCEWCLVHDASC